MIKSKEALSGILRNPLVPLFNHSDIELCKQVLNVCYAEGIRVFEFPCRLENALDVFRELRKYCSEELDGMLLGVGTIKTAHDAERYIDEGADFMISPSIPREVAEIAQKHDVLWIPGCASPTEINVAESLGIELVKIFPAKQLGGPAFIRAMKGPFPDMKYMASGGVGVEEAELRDWFSAGVSNIAITSHLFRKDWLAEPGHPKISENVRNTVALLRRLIPE